MEYVLVKASSPFNKKGMFLYASPAAKNHKLHS